MKIEINIDDKLIAKVRGFFSRRNVIVIFACIFMMSIVLYAADKKFTIFKAHTPILSEEVNANFALMPPVGSIVAFAGASDNIPDGWLECDGSILSKNEYDELYKVIGTAWGKDGSNSDKFYLPDLRGRFLRGVDKTGINDEDSGNRRALYDGNTGNTVGSYQEDAIRNIKGYFLISGTENLSIDTEGAFVWNGSIGGSFSSGHSVGAKVPKIDFDASRCFPNNVGSDHRPKNAYVYYIIRAR